VKLGCLLVLVLGPRKEARAVSTAQAPDTLILKEVVGATHEWLAAVLLGRRWWWECTTPYVFVTTRKWGVERPDATPARRSGLH